MPSLIIIAALAALATVSAAAVANEPFSRPISFQCPEVIEVSPFSDPIELYQDPSDDTAYFECTLERAKKKMCEAGYVFNPLSKSCVPRPEGTLESSDDSSPSLLNFFKEEDTHNDEDTHLTDTSGTSIQFNELPVLRKVEDLSHLNSFECPELIEVTKFTKELFRDLSDETAYFECTVNGAEKKMCEKGLVFNLESRSCGPREDILATDHFDNSSPSLQTSFPLKTTNNHVIETGDASGYSPVHFYTDGLQLDLLSFDPIGGIADTTKIICEEGFEFSLKQEMCVSVWDC